MQNELPESEKREAAVKQLKRMWKPLDACMLQQQLELERTFPPETQQATWNSMMVEANRFGDIRNCVHHHYGHCAVDGAKYHDAVVGVGSFLKKLHSLEAKTARYCIHPARGVQLWLRVCGGTLKTDDAIQTYLSLSLCDHDAYRCRHLSEELWVYPIHDIPRAGLQQKLVYTEKIETFAGKEFLHANQRSTYELLELLARPGLGPLDGWEIEKVTAKHTSKTSFTAGDVLQRWDELHKETL